MRAKTSITAPFQQQLRAAVESNPGEAHDGRRPGISATYTGSVPIIYKARRSLLDGLILGFGTDVSLIVIAVACC